MRRFYGASGEEIISIGADVPNDGAPSCHGNVSRMTLAIPLDLDTTLIAVVELSLSSC